jgi:cell division protein FtsL
MSTASGARPWANGPRTRGAALGWIVACAFLLTLAALGFVWQRYEFVRAGFEVGALRQRQARLQERIAPLEIEVEYLSRPERIESIARERLGLRAPLPSELVLLERSADVTEPKP